MTVREILIYPQRKTELRKKSAPVTGLNKQVKRVIRDLKDTLQEGADGIGLAAPQINSHLRVVVVCLGASGDGSSQAEAPIALLNPVITEARDERIDFDGCLSFPGLYGKTSRPHYLRVEGLDENGQAFDRVFTGFDAVVVHHEIDHLDGVLFIDRIEKMEDLYRVRENEHGELVKVPLTLNIA